MFGRLHHSPGAATDKASSLLYIIGCKDLYIYMDSISHRLALEGGTIGSSSSTRRLRGGEGAAHIHQSDKEISMSLCVCVWELCQHG